MRKKTTIPVGFIQANGGPQVNLSLRPLCPIIKLKFYCLFPFQVNIFETLHIGGFQSVDVLTENGWKNVSSFPISYHCTVLYNSTTVLLIGGVSQLGGGDANNETYFFNTETADPEWTPGPSLQFSRGDHKCSRIKRDAQSSEFSIIVVGGSASVEILGNIDNAYKGKG